jgi:hypothetical protein
LSQFVDQEASPPAPNRTDSYQKMDELLKLPRGKLAKLATHRSGSSSSAI